MGYVTLNGITVPITDIDLDTQLARPVNQVIGADGSNTNYQGSGGRLLSLSVFANKDQYPHIRKFYESKKRLTLVSKSTAKYNGFYHVTSFTHKEYKPGRFQISMKLQEDFKFNAVRKNFIDYNIKIKQSKVQVKVGDKWSTEA